MFDSGAIVDADPRNLKSIGIIRSESKRAWSLVIKGSSLPILTGSYGFVMVVAKLEAKVVRVAFIGGDAVKLEDIIHRRVGIGCINTEYLETLKERIRVY